MLYPVQNEYIGIMGITDKNIYIFYNNINEQLLPEFIDTLQLEAELDELFWE